VPTMIYQAALLSHEVTGTNVWGGILGIHETCEASDPLCLLAAVRKPHMLEGVVGSLLPLSAFSCAL